MFSSKIVPCGLFRCNGAHRVARIRKSGQLGAILFVLQFFLLACSQKSKMVSIISIAHCYCGFVLTQFLVQTVWPCFRWLFCPPDRCLAKPHGLYSEALFGYGLDVRDELLTLNLIYHEHNIYFSSGNVGIMGLLAYTANYHVCASGV